MKSLGFLLFGAVALAQYPVLIIKGLFDHPKSMQHVVDNINLHKPGTQVLVADCYNGIMSTVPIFDQLPCWIKALRSLPSPKHVISFSQGGLVARAVLSTVPDHGVMNWISLSSPQMGQYGLTSFIKKYLPAEFRNMTKEEATKAFFTPELQSTDSVANFWNDPTNQPLYIQQSQFLAILNNQSYTSASYEWRSNFLSLSGTVTLVGGPEDGVITPYYSAFFGFYNASLGEVDMRDQEVYQGDYFGLKTLDSQNRIHKYMFRNVTHLQWRENDEVFQTAILPYLL